MIPIPVTPETVAGTDIQKEATMFLQIGMTTREEILERFGEPDWTFDDIGIIAYCWSKHQWDLWVTAGAEGDKFEFGKNYLMLFLFDSDLKVSGILQIIFLPDERA